MTAGFFAFGAAALGCIGMSVTGALDKPAGRHQSLLISSGTEQDAMKGAEDPGAARLHGMACRPRTFALDSERDLLERRANAKSLEWAGLISVLRGRGETLPDAVVQRILGELRAGRTGGMLVALAALRDSLLVRQLVSMLDEPDLPVSSSRVVYTALASLPALEPAKVVSALKQRLTGDVAVDRVVLEAIGVRSGAEATCVFLTYLEAAEEPTATAMAILPFLHPGADERSRGLMQEALRGEGGHPVVRRELLRVVSRANMTTLRSTVLALDHESSPWIVRKEALAVLGQLGGVAAIRHLLTASKRPGALGRTAIWALGTITESNAAGRVALVEALDTRRLSEETSVRILHALGTLGHSPAAGIFAAHLAHDSKRVQREAVRGLKRLHRGAAPYVADLLSSFDAGDSAHRRHIIEALAAIDSSVACDAMVELEASGP